MQLPLQLLNVLVYDGSGDRASVNGGAINYIGYKDSTIDSTSSLPSTTGSNSGQIKIISAAYTEYCKMGIFTGCL